MNEKETPKVKLRNGFSDRHGISTINTSMQTVDLDHRTRIALINCLFDWISCLDNVVRAGNYGDTTLQSFYRKLLREAFVYGVTVAHGQLATGELFGKYIKDVILKSTYDEVLTLVEYITVYFDNRDSFYKSHEHVKNLNAIFEKEFVGYRFIGQQIVPITDEIEVKEIEQSLEIQFEGCKIQLQNALRCLSDRDKPDYKNSIKESISAVESICKVIADKEHASLGDALKILDKKHKINGQLKAAFGKLYDYTNDEGGIRHSEGLFASDVTFEEAKYMLVSCCAFVNYLIAEYGKIEG